jgi:hypothetical protein
MPTLYKINFRAHCRNETQTTYFCLDLRAASHLIIVNDLLSDIINSAGHDDSTINTTFTLVTMIRIIYHTKKLVIRSIFFLMLLSWQKSDHELVETVLTFEAAYRTAVRWFSS